MTYNISVIKGDGIGPEVINVALDVLKKIEENNSITFEFDEYEAGDACFKERGEAFPKETFDGIKKSDALFLGAIGETAAQVLLPIRQKLELFANIRPIKSYNSDVDFVFFRENTEGLYMSKGERNSEKAVDTRTITRRGSERIARAACDYAISKNIDKITVVDKSNVLETCKLFRETVLDVISEYPIKLECMYVDNAAMQIVKDPTQFQMIVTTNMFGDILSDLAAPFAGGLGLIPSANIGENFGMFEPVHGTAPGMAGKGTANPIAAVMSAKMMLDYFEEMKNAEKIENAVIKTAKEKHERTIEIQNSIIGNLVIRKRF